MVHLNRLILLYSLSTIRTTEAFLANTRPLSFWKIQRPDAQSPSFHITIKSSTSSLLKRVVIPASDDDNAEKYDLLPDTSNESEIQWELFKKYHSSKKSWKGVWTTYDYLGDAILETIASVNYEAMQDDRSVNVSHSIVVGATKSDCATCFDNMQIKTLPVAQYTPATMTARRTRLGACGMVVGPSILRNGAMATEMVLSHGDGRVRVIFQYAPVWEKGIEPGSGPPQGLKLYRCLVSKEAARETPPTAESEAMNPPSYGNPTFVRSVPPFEWHKKWAGTSWTWGPEAGNRGWSIDELEEGDAWQANMPVEMWNLLLPGGLFVQTPRVIRAEEVGMLRMAWLPTSESLLRLEASVRALRPIFMDNNEDVDVLAPPTLASFRCDVLTKVGELEEAPSLLAYDDLEGKNIEAVVPMQVQKDGFGRDGERPKDKGDPNAKTIKDILNL